MSLYPYYFFAFSLIGYFQELLNWFLIVLGVGFLVFIHELGHFLAAKYEGVRVEAFALGFGHPLFKKQWGETEYRLNILPLGGYVKMAGEFLGEDATGADDEFTSKKPGQRARILVAGVVMNAIFGIIGIIIAFQIGIRFISPTVGAVVPGSPAWHAGLKEGDHVLQVNDMKISNFKDLSTAVAFSEKGESLKFHIVRDGQQETKELTPKIDEERGFPTIGVYPTLLPYLRVTRGSVLEEKGILETDRIIAINGEAVATGNDIRKVLSGVETSPLKVTFETIDKKSKQVEIPLQFQSSYLLGITTRQLTVDSLRTPWEQKLDLKKGDIIWKINGKLVSGPDEYKQQIQAKNLVTILRDGKQVEQTWELKPDEVSLFENVIYFVTDPFVGKVKDDFPAFGKLQTGDKITEINQKKIESWYDVAVAVSSANGSELEVSVQRENETKSFKITPKKKEFPVIQLGLLPKMTPPQQYGVLESCKYGLIHSQQMVIEIFSMLKGLLNQRIAAKNLGGPITIFAASHTTLEQFGVGYFIYFLALLSINLAVLNLLPIPVLDGGHLVFVGIEKLMGRPVSENVVIWTNYAGVLFLISLMIFVTIHDAFRWIF